MQRESYEADVNRERRSNSASFGSTRVGIVRLPNALVEGVQSVVHSVNNRSTIRTSALSLYSRYRLTSPRDSLEKSVDELRASIDQQAPCPKKSEPTVKAKLKTSYDHLGTISYAAGAMPSTYGATLRVLSETKRRLSSERAASTTQRKWEPKVILDYGSGTGGAAWAAKEIWPESLSRYYGLEKSSSMIWLSDHLLNPPPHEPRTHPWPSKLQTSFHRLTISVPKSRKGSKDSNASQHLMKALAKADADGLDEVDFDLPESALDWDLDPRNLMAIMSFTLSDLANADARRQAILGMWNSGAEIMVVIDRGTPAGFEVVADARQQLLMLGRRAIRDSQSDVTETTEKVAHETRDASSGSWVLAPCPHDQACPLHHSSNPNHFCHFSQRIERPKFLKETKHADKPEEDSKFSYVVIRRGQRPKTASDAQSALLPVGEESGMLWDVRSEQPAAG